MAEPKSSLSSSPYARRERPWLLPTNHKLRNLESVSLRNLDLTPTTPARQRTRPVDDDALPQTSNSPAKLVALREQRELGYSRSSTDLKAVLEQHAVDGAEREVSRADHDSPVAARQPHRSHSNDGSPQRPSAKRMRRRSTMEWTNATPGRRQQKLEGVIEERMCDVFFSLHIQDVDEPIYVSEMNTRTMNPTFRRIDWSRCGPGITRSESLTLRVWSRGTRHSRWSQLLQLKANLSALHYLGKKLEDVDSSLPSNAVIFHFADGVYLASGDPISTLAARARSDHIQNAIPSAVASSFTSTFDALLRLAKLDDSIQDALSVRHQLAQDLENLLLTHREALLQKDAVAEAEDRLKTIDYAKRTVEKQLEKARAQRLEKRASLEARRTLMSSGVNEMALQQTSISEARPEFPSWKDQHYARDKAIQNQRRRICEELQRCYPIQPMAKKPLAFSIRELYLPNSEDLDVEPTEYVAAALGHVAHVLQLLSFYLTYALPYPVTPCGSTSTIYDPISILKSNTSTTSSAAEFKLRTYPLYSKGMARFRFDYAVFLLNQNIRVLLESVCHVHVVDIRQTLPNLKYLLYVATAGEGELPSRKAGGVRGLLKSPSLDRRGSQGSVASDMSGSTLHANGKARTAIERLREIGGKV